MNHLLEYDEFISLNEKRSVQDRADLINDFGKLAKRKDIEEMIKAYYEEEDKYVYDNPIAVLKNYDSIIDKYKLRKKFDKAFKEFFSIGVDPAGGSGLHSHK